tara:strand:- start:159 stop:476 length:318 start_codon:yes stop_codon:yes gene_type:complete
MNITFNRCTVLQNGRAYLFYRHDKGIGGYLALTIAIGDDFKDKKNFAELLKYFFNEIVIDDDLYVSFVDNDNGWFKYIDETPIEYGKHTIYKVKRYNNGKFEEEA